MDARCPLCTSIFQTDHTGIQACPNCGKQVNVAEPPRTPVAPQPPPPATPSPAGAPGHGPGPTFLLPASPYMSPPEPERPAGADVAGPGVPWEQRAGRSLVNAYVDTVKQGVFEPTAFFTGAGPSRGVADPLLFAWLTAVLGSLPELGLQLLMQGGGMQDQVVQTLLSSPTLDEPSRKLLTALVESGTSAAGAVGTTVGWWVMFPVAFFITAGILHVSALVCGAGKQGFEATVRALGYGCAPLLLTVVPCLPALYATVLWGMGLQHLQRTTTGRATTVLLLAGALVSLCWCGVSLVAVAASMSALAGAK